jgi:type II secretory ATPase GspE/PulE/Tfp pilus assembly ATPase PilB-like protein
MIPYAFAKAHGVVVTSVEGGFAQVAVRGDARSGALAELRRMLGVPLRARRMEAAEFDELVAASYSGADAGAAALAVDLAQDLDLSRLLQEIPKVEDLLESRDDAPVIRLINALFTQALRDGASDIHIEPFETRSLVRLRIDGTLRDLIEPARALHGAIVSRVKIMAQLDIAEKRLPQDGRISLKVAGTLSRSMSTLYATIMSNRLSANGRAVASATAYSWAESVSTAALTSSATGSAAVTRYPRPFITRDTRPSPHPMSRASPSPGPTKSTRDSR